MQFEIEWASDKHLGTVIARRIGDKQFDVFDDSLLGGFPLLRQLDMPRKLDANGNPRMDLFAFYLRNKSDVDKFALGQTVELSRANA